MRSFPSILAAVLVAGCGVTGTDPALVSDPPALIPTPPEYASAPESVVSDGQAIVLGATLWRDFMPPSPPNGRPLVVGASVRGVDPGTMTSAFQVLRLDVVRDRVTWVTRFEPAPSIPEIAAVTARGGPKWGPDEIVDVIARLRLPDGTETLLAVRGVRISKSE